MITAVEVTRLKRFHHERFELDEVTLLAGPNNAGESTVVQALALWRFALTFWNQRRAGTGARERTGVVLTRQQLTALPLREMSLLWEDRHIGRSQDTQIELRVHGDDDGGWECGIELQYANPESAYVRPLGARKDVDLSDFPPTAAATVQTVHVPALAGISPDEPRYDRAYQDLLIGSGNAGQVLRNLLLEVAAMPAAWKELVGAVDRLFRVELLAPQSQGLPYIVAEYRTGPGRKELDLANADLFSSVAGLSRLKASTEFLPTLLEAAGRPLPKPDLFLIAQALRPEEVHPEVIEKLDAIAALAGPDA